MKARLFLTISIAATMLWSCQFDDVLSTPSNGGVIRVTSTLTKTESASGTTTNSHTTNDNFKKEEIIFVWANKTNGSGDDYIKAWELTATGTNGNFSGESKAWPYDGSSLDFHALHGNFTESDLYKNWSDLTSLTHTVLDNQSSDDDRRQSDLLFAEITGVTHGSNVELSFSHLLAKITVKLDLTNSKGINEGELANAEVKLTNILPDATISNTSLTANPVQTSTTGTRTTIISGKIPSSIISGDVIGCAIVPLQDFGGGKSPSSDDNVITITLDSPASRSFSYKPTNPVALTAGNEYIYTLKIINGELSVSSISVRDFTNETTPKSWDIYVESSGS